MEGSPERIPASRIGLIIAGISLALMTTLSGREARAETSPKDQSTVITEIKFECPACGALLTAVQNWIKHRKD